MASYSEGQELIFKNNINIDGTCLNRGRLHLNIYDLNKKGYSKFSLKVLCYLQSEKI